MVYKYTKTHKYMIIETALESEEIQRLRKLDLSTLAEELVSKRESNLINGLFGSLPVDNIQSQFTGLSQKETFIQALTYLDLCRKKAGDLQCEFIREKSNCVLDFGCGWGRITQLLSLYFNPTNIMACDVMDDALNIVKESKVKATFAKIESWPPSLYRDESVDYIFAYSVFSHLSEDNSWAWIREFHRILRPGGIAFLTTRHRNHLDYLQSLHDSENIPDFARGAYRAFKDIENSKIQYDEGIFCFDPMGGGGNGLTHVYGEAFIPQKYVTEKYGRIFSRVGFEDPKPEGLLDQATIWLQK
jgi:2-polyprenyl-3-methyl-5-hydroxy-6-metoxy-1,4-benzoquinol methylase